MMVPSAIVRPWLKTGLSALLLESPQRVAELRASKEETLEESSAPRSAGVPRQVPPSFRAPAPERRGVSRPQPPSSRTGASFSPESQTQSPFPRSEASDQVRQGLASRPAAGAAQKRPGPDSDGGLLATPGALPVEKWPASWLALKNRRPLPPRPLVLWTYAGLGEDLVGRPDDVRRQVIVRMLMELRHPGGTHVFWPCGLAGEKPEDGPALFWSGVKLLNPRVLLLFGSDARDTLSMPKTLLPFCQERVYGRLVIQLPRPQSLAQDEASFKRALAFLSQLLRFCSRRQA